MIDNFKLFNNNKKRNPLELEYDTPGFSTRYFRFSNQTQNKILDLRFLNNYVTVLYQNTIDLLRKQGPSNLLK